VILDCGDRIVIDDPDQLQCYRGALTFCDSVGELHMADPEEVAEVIDLASADPVA
jgi:hypothetical protein